MTGWKGTSYEQGDGGVMGSSEQLCLAEMY